jgi:transcription elongation factor GreA
VHDEVVENLTLSQAISAHLQSVDTLERQLAAQELARFARWYGGDRPIRAISPGDLERYQDQLSSTGGNPARLEPLRQFFVSARQRKLLDQPLATHVRARRKAGSRLSSQGGTLEAVELTQTGYDQLQAELERLETVHQPRARDMLGKAYADKDFRENAPYDAAKQHLADLQRRVNEIKSMLGNATIVEERQSTDRAGLGATVIVRDLEEDEELTYTLVGPGEVDPRNGKISVQSPVGRALTDRQAGETVEVETPAGLARFRIERLER